MEDRPLLTVKGLRKYFPIMKGVLVKRHAGDIKAVDGLDFSICAGETLGLVGESGCGKSTTGRALLRLYEPTGGEIWFGETNVAMLRGAKLRQLRRQMQMIFQDPYASLDPRMRIDATIGEPLDIHGVLKGHEKQTRIRELMELVGLSPEHGGRFPHELSCGQRQRVGVARALALQPRFIVCDEPVSSLDVSIQAQIINLLRRLQRDLNLTYLFIAHDLAVVRHISDRIAVMYLGKIVEMTDRVELFKTPLHPYTKALLSAVPVPDPVVERKRERILLAGDVPSPANPPSGCRFHTRCPIAKFPLCKEEEPRLSERGALHQVACHLA
jgi:oligopeptide transport system ATP-binding protein